MKGVRQARQTATRLSRIQVPNRGPMRVAGERSWRLLCPPPLLFPLGIVGLPATRSWRAKESSGSGSIRSDIDISTSSRSGKTATLNHVNSEWHKPGNANLTPSMSLWPQNSVAGEFLPPAVVAFFPSSKPAWAECGRRGSVAHSRLAVCGVHRAVALSVLAVGTEKMMVRWCRNWNRSTREGRV